MCGICGFWDPSATRSVDRDLLASMQAALRHRGPDDSGALVDDANAMALGFRRLAILDLSPAGHQPMTDGDSGVWIVFNGEVYNHAELRSELEAKGCTFSSRSDTETILKAYRVWGDRCIERFIGMFAFVIWDRPQRRVFAARDRLGIKPFYYSTADRRFAFASELGSLALLPWIDRAVDPAALREYLSRGYICAPRSILRSVRMLPPGHSLAWRAGESEPSVRRYWSALDHYAPSTAKRSDDDWADELDALLRSAVKYRLLSDVPLGAFLSGGVDSSAVVAMMRQVTSDEVKTFTIGFGEAEYDESQHAEAVARHLGTTHTTMMVSPADVRALIPRLPEIAGEPFADSSQLPTYLLSKLTREHVTVALSGDGGDELFCGYDSYRRLARWQHAWAVPAPLRRGVGRLARLVPNRRIALAGEGLALPEPVSFSKHYASVWRASEIDALAPDLRAAIEPLPALDGMPLLDALMLTDILTYLPNDVLQKVDRASMAVSLEARVPLLDHRVVEFCMRLPLHMKWRNRTSKVLLRRVLYRYVPPALIERPKRGFAVPLDEWLRRDLRELIDHYLDPARIRREGIFRPEAVTAAVRRFLAGGSRHARVWTLLLFEMWRERLAVPEAMQRTEPLAAQVLSS